MRVLILMLVGLSCTGTHGVPRSDHSRPHDAGDIKATLRSLAHGRQSQSDGQHRASNQKVLEGLLLALNPEVASKPFATDLGAPLEALLLALHPEMAFKPFAPGLRAPLQAARPATLRNMYMTTADNSQIPALQQDSDIGRVKQVERVSLIELLEEPMAKRWTRLKSGPLVVTDLYLDQDPDIIEAGGVIDALVSEFGNETVEYHVHETATKLAELWQAPLSIAMSEIALESSHAKSRFLMAEGMVPNVVEDLCRSMVEAMMCEEGEPDLFDLMPEGFSPSCCLLVGGNGARSNLHADPFEWLGWNVLFEGYKLWTFYPPEATESHLQMQRNPPGAWGGADENGHGAIAAGWESPIDLYFGQSMAADEQVHSSRQFVPSEPVPLAAGTPLEVVQRPGEMVLIPPKWTHQTLHCSPTVAVAGQLLANQGFASVAAHCLKWCGAAEHDAALRAEALASIADPCEKVDKLLRDCGIEEAVGTE